jgi:predicted nuclease with TOPRIM domain
MSLLLPYYYGQLISEIDKARQEIANSCQELEQQKQQVAEQMRQNDKARQEIDTARQELEQQKQQVAEQLRQYASEIDKARQEIDKSRQELEQADDRCAANAHQLDLTLMAGEIGKSHYSDIYIFAQQKYSHYKNSSINNPQKSIILQSLQFYKHTSFQLHKYCCPRCYFTYCTITEELAENVINKTQEKLKLSKHTYPFI